MPVVTDKLVTPAVVKKYVDNLAAEPDITPDQLAEVERTLTLSYHHGGLEAVCRGRGDDFELLFVGTIEETLDWFDGATEEQRRGAYIDRPYTWKTTKREWGIRD